MSARTWTVSEIASAVGVPCHGEGTTPATGVASLDAIRPGVIVFAERERDLPRALESQAAAVVTATLPADAITRPAVLHSQQVRLTFAQISQLFFPGYPRETPGIHPATVVHPSVELGANVAIGPGCIVGRGCKIGDNTILRPNVVIDEESTIGADCYLFPGVVIGRRSVLGDRCTVHPNAVIGGEGFGFTEGADATTKQPQFGGVRLGNDCEIGAGTTIDRGTLDDTVLGDDVKIDNLVQIGHNCQLGNHIRIAAQCGLAGGAVIEDYCILAGQAGVHNRVRIGRGSIVGGRAGVTRDAPAGSQLWGLPARNHRDVLKDMVFMQRLPEIVARLDAVENRLKQSPAEEE